MAIKKKVTELHGTAATHEKLDIRLARLRQLVLEGEHQQVEMMIALMELYEHKEIWSPRYPTWDEFLLEEGFTTRHTFGGFIKAHAEFGQAEVRRLGVRASTLLIRQPKATRTKVLGLVNGWMKTHPIPPTYQRVSTYTKIVLGTLNKPKQAKGDKRSQDEKLVQLRKDNRALVAENARLNDFNERLKKHIWKLSGTLRRNKIDVPKAPEA